MCIEHTAVLSLFFLVYISLSCSFICSNKSIQAQTIIMIHIYIQCIYIPINTIPPLQRPTHPYTQVVPIAKNILLFGGPRFSVQQTLALFVLAFLVWGWFTVQFKVMQSRISSTRYHLLCVSPGFAQSRTTLFLLPFSLCSPVCVLFTKKKLLISCRKVTNLDQAGRIGTQFHTGQTKLLIHIMSEFPQQAQNITCC